MSEEITQNILLIEDEEALSSILKERLIDEGYSVQVAGNGHEALEHASNVKPDIILLDILMPRMDGFEFLKRFRKQTDFIDIPVIILSNLSQELDKDTGRSLGAVEFIVKSNFSIDSIVERIRHHLTNDGVDNA